MSRNIWKKSEQNVKTEDGSVFSSKSFSISIFVICLSYMKVSFHIFSIFLRKETIISYLFELMPG